MLGLWIAQTEGAKFWLQVVTELKNRGVTDIFIACVDGLKGFPEAIESVSPQTEVQLCIVHLARHSLNYVGWKQRKEVAADLKLIYTPATDVEAEQRLAELSLKCVLSREPWHSKSFYLLQATKTHLRFADSFKIKNSCVRSCRNWFLSFLHDSQQ